MEIITNLYTSFKKYMVDAESLQDFINRYHRPGSITDFNREADYNAHKQDLEKDGFTFIPKGTSITGEIVSYYGKI